MLSSFTAVEIRFALRYDLEILLNEIIFEIFGHMRKNEGKIELDILS